MFATTALKASDGFTKFYPSALCVVSYAITFYCLSLTLRTMPTGIVYAVWSGVGIVLISTIAWIVSVQRAHLYSVFSAG